MDTEQFPPLLSRAMQASLKPSALNFFWGLSLGFITMIFPNLWVKVIGGALYLLAFVWFTLCLMARKDLKPINVVATTGTMQKGKIATQLELAQSPANLAAPLASPHGRVYFDPEEFASVWKAYNDAKAQREEVREQDLGGRAG